MVAFEVKDMTCGHCVNTITKAVKGADSGALVTIDLPSKRVEISSASATAQELKFAILKAGYTPVEADGAPSPPSARKSGSCCGCSR